jgi:hypothetical protein
MARCEGVGPARRTRRLLRVALTLRAAAWRTAALVPGNRSARRARAEAFALGARTIAAIELDAIAAPVIPEWDVVQRESGHAR